MNFLMAKIEQWLTEEGLLQLEAWARNGLTDEQIAANIGIGKTTLYRWKNEFREIRESLKKGKEVVDIQVENALLKRALGYTYTEVTKERIIDTGQKERHGGETELTEQEWFFAQKYFNGKCAYCGEDTSHPTKDHIKPLISGGTLRMDNVLPCCQKCNSSKKDNEMISWFEAQKFYKPERLSKIMDYINLVLSLKAMPSTTSELVVTKEVTKTVVPDTTAQIFWLKNRKPEEWRDKKDVEHSGVVNNPFATLSTEQLLKLVGDDEE